ncbi:MAG: hypothetical protein FJ295_02165 [Planctomycetes bacterium]|nr:hypothetical protein [Planctomycetota bacterium]
MVGQGSPRFCIALGIVAVLVSACFCCAPVAAVDPIELRLRLRWGGGETPKNWRVTARISEGEIREPLGLGSNPDDPGSIVVNKSTLSVMSPSASLESAVDFTLLAPRDAILAVEWSDGEGSTSPQRMDVPLADLIGKSLSRVMDDQRHEISIERAPGDRLRVELPRDALVMEPNELFIFGLLPHRIGVEGESTLRCRIQLTRARSDDPLWTTEKEIRVDRDGNGITTTPIQVTAPGNEGVFDVVITLMKKRLTDSISLVPAKPIAQRRIQFVVIHPRSQLDVRGKGQESVGWKPIAEIDPVQSGAVSDMTGSRWTDWLRKMPQLKLPGFNKGPLGAAKVSRVEHAGRPGLRMEPGSWQAYPLPVVRPDEPHLLEIEYAADQRQTLGISFVEPDAGGRVAPVSGLDFGLDVSSASDREPRWARHRVIFWPRTKTPLLLLTNRRDREPVICGRIAISAGPARLPAMSGPADGFESRRYLLHLTKPLVQKTLGGGDVIDGPTGAVLSDWVTFYEAGRRLSEYLKYHGYGTAVVTIACEGSALYPSAITGPNTLYDSGQRFSTGQDPVRKDILEMLCRIFDREGLRLIPAIQFATPIPELEELRRAGRGSSAGLDWLDAQGRSWRELHGTNRRLAPYYNPLDERVQAVMTRVVEEIADRYGSHPSLAGVALQLGPDTFAQLPDGRGSYDDTTIAGFESAAGVRVPGNGLGLLEQRVAFCDGDAREAWLDWRAGQLTNLYQRMAETVSERTHNGRLYLSTCDLLLTARMQKLLRPRLLGEVETNREVAVPEALRELGLDWGKLEQDPRIVVFRPQRFGPTTSVAAQGVNLESETSLELDNCFRGELRAAVEWCQENLDTAVPEFDAVSPFGADRTKTWLSSQIVPAGAANRRRLIQSLATLDAQLIMDTGWTLTMGNEESLANQLEVFRKLPAERFSTAAAQIPTRGQPVTVRFLNRGNRSFVYAVNDSPWPLTAAIELTGTGVEAKATPLGRVAAAPSVERVANGIRWTVNMEAYDLQALALNSGEVRVRDWTVSVEESVLTELDQRLQDITTRRHELRSPKPIVPLRNSGFENLGRNEAIPGWEFRQDPRVLVKVDSASAASGGHSLRLKSDGEVVWIRSEPFSSPRTGRLAVGAKIRIDRAAPQPELRIAVDDGQNYYPHVTIGATEKPLTTEWTEYQLFIDGVPSSSGDELRVGFDLMGKGEVWIDDVHVYGMWLDRSEGLELSKSISQAIFLRNKLAIGDCRAFLDSYWPQLLEQHVPLPSRVAARDPAAAPAEKPKATSWLDKVNGMLPKKLTR